MLHCEKSSPTGNINGKGFDEFAEISPMSKENTEGKGGSMGTKICSPIKRALNAVGLDLVRYSGECHRTPFPDISPEDSETIRAVIPYTLTSAKRIQVLCEATRHISRAGIPGDVVECGVWRGGSMMAVARTLLGESDRARSLYLFDTFEGMTDPTEYDVSVDGETAAVLLRGTQKSEDRESPWCVAGKDGVRDAMERTNYPVDRIHLIQGRVEETVPGMAPDRIALLRLDTDWYESTRHEMEHLYPRLEQGGVLIVDDYGHWKGARKAVDEYLERTGHRIMLHRIDYTGRIGVRAFRNSGRQTGLGKNL